MPRTRRTTASETPAEDAAQVETPPVNSDTPANTSDTPKTPRRRAPRKPKAGTVAAETAPGPEALIPEAQVVENAAKDAQAQEAPGVETPAPTRRRGRRTASAVPVAVANEPQTPPDAPATAETKAPPPARRRGRRTASPETTTEAISETAVAAASEPAVQSAALPEIEAPISQPANIAQPAAAAAETPAPTRRRGRARKNAEETPPASPPEATDTAAAPPEEAAPTRRRGRRRSTSVLLGDAPPALPDVEAPVTGDVLSEEAASEEDAEKRGKRSRRSRRRRGGLEEVTTEMLEAAGSSLLLPEEVIAEDVPDEDDDDALVVYPPPAAPTYAAPPLVSVVLPPADDSQAPRVTAVLRPAPRGLAKISVNSADHAPYFFFVNSETARDGETVEAQIRAAAANGIHLFSGVMYLPLRNAYGDRSFGAIDALVQQILTADPDGFILPRLQFVPTNYWVRTHTDQLAAYASGEEGDVSLASTEFWADCVDALDALLAHFADPGTPGGDRVIGFHLDRGEWFYDASMGYDLSLPNRTAFQNWLHAKYQNLYALRAAWHDAEITFEDADIPAFPAKTPIKKTDTPLYSARREGRWPDYAQFSSEIVADVIAGLAAAIKTLSLGRLLVAASYGYTLEFANRNDSGHLALGKLLQSPHIDIIAGPNSYAGRGAGSPAAFGAPLDSVALHGKLWLVEDDTKTFLADTETDDTYNPRIASGADTQAIHQRHFGAALAHRAGVTWMDLWGQGWLNSPDIWRELGGLAAQSARWEALVPNPPVTPDVAVFVDEASLAYLKSDPNGLGTNLVGRSRDLLLKAGGSVGFYLQSDVTQPSFPDAKLYLFLNALRLTTEERSAIREKLQKPGKTLAWLYAPGMFDENGPSSEEVGEVVGMALRPQPWNSRGGSTATELKHPLTDRIRGVKRLGTDEILNPLYAVSDPQAVVVAEYTATGAPSLAVREHKAGWKSVFFGDPYLTTELLRGLYAYAGISVYDSQDDSVYAGSDGSLTIHGSFTGQRTITLPRRASVYDVFENKIVAANALSFRAFVRARTTRLFLWGAGDILARATGLDLPDQSAEVEVVPAAAPPQVSAPPPSTSMSSTPPPASMPPLVIREEVLVSVVIPSENIPGLEAELPGELSAAMETLDAAFGESDDSEDANAEGGEETDASGAPLRRSRWQRRRAAARARRDAERAAKLAEPNPDGTASAPVPALDMATLLPGLPPRRTPPPASARVADIVAADIADDEALGFSDNAALGLSDAALTDMADDLGAAEAEEAGE